MMDCLSCRGVAPKKQNRDTTYYYAVSTSGMRMPCIYGCPGCFVAKVDIFRRRKILIMQYRIRCSIEGAGEKNI